MPTPLRIDPEVEAKAFATLLGTVLVGLAKWVWEEGKKRGRKRPKTPDAERIVDLERQVAQEKARADYATAECFDVRNKWSERTAAHVAKQQRMYERMKSAEGKARSLGADLVDARHEIEDLKGELTRLAYEPRRHEQAGP